MNDKRIIFDRQIGQAKAPIAFRGRKIDEIEPAVGQIKVFYFFKNMGRKPEIPRLIKIHGLREFLWRNHVGLHKGNIVLFQGVFHKPIDLGIGARRA